MDAKMWNELAPADLPGDLEEIARARGMEAARYFAEAWGGVQLYIPSRSTIRKLWRDERILREYDGTNAAELATRYDVNRRYIRDLLRETTS